MKLEVLYPELCNLYGEMANMRYLCACVPEAQRIETHLSDRPAFLDGGVDLVYMGAMTERGQELALERLRPLTDQLRDRIEAGQLILATGNAMELFGRGIREGDKRLECLGIFGYEAERDMEHRHNSMFWGTLEAMSVVGCKSQYSHLTGSTGEPMLHVEGGYGTDLKGKEEGIRHRNFFGTYVLGPLLPLNPPLTRYLLGLAGYEGPLAFEADAMAAYELRLRQLQRPGVNFLVGEHG